MARTKVFVSYSRKDKKSLDELRTHLAPLHDVLDVWDDQRQEAGKPWLRQIEAALAEARLAVLLVSPDFMASRFINEHEVPPLLLRAAEDGVPILCVYVRPAVVERKYVIVDRATGERRTITLPEFRGLNAPDEPLSLLGKPQREQRWVEIALKIKDVANASPAPTADLTPYFTALREKTQWLRLQGLGEKQAQQVPLAHVYTKLRVASSSAAEPGARGRTAGKGAQQPGASRDGEPTAVELKDLLGRHEHLVLVGDPGAGKTTFLRFVALNLARAWLDDERAASLERIGWTGEPPFPVLVSLGEFGQYLETLPAGQRPADSPEHFYGWLDVLARDGGGGLPEGCLRERVRGGGCLLLLDGLDEVPGETMRERVGAIVSRVLHEGRERGNRHVVTCRTRAYQGGTQLGPEFTRATLVDFGKEEIETFVTQWSSALHVHAGAGSDAAARHARELLAAIEAHPHVRPLSTNPLLLTMLAVVHWSQQRLPEGRAELYDVAVKHLLRGRATHSDYSLTSRREALREIARRLFEDEQGVRKSLDRREAAQAAAGALLVKDAAALAFVDDEGLHSNILVSRSLGEVEFWHPTFGEYLAAEAFAGERDYWTLLREHVFDPRWSEVVLLLAGCLKLQGPRAAAGFIRDILGTGQDMASRARAVGLVGRIVRDLLPYGGDPAHGTGYVEALHSVLPIFEPGGVDVPESVRVEVGEALGLAGDPRISDDDHANRIFIKGGTFWMGAQADDAAQPGYDPDSFDDEKPVHRVTVSDFWMDRYPVTVARFRRFVEAGAEGYFDAQLWSEAGWRLREEHGWEEPSWWVEQLRHLNRPVVGVNWYEAEAYCAWLSRRSGRRVVLPTEAQWEYAARGEAGRKYPWGGAEPTDRHMNFDNRVGHPTAVGIYPLGATPEGLQDLSGNVWEWCADWRGEYEHDDQRDPTGPNDGRARVLRGGGFDTNARLCRAAYRGYNLPENDFDNVGFRCVVVVSGGHQ